MPKTRQQKEATLKKLEENLAKMKAAYFTNFDGLKVKETVELRKLLREQNISYEVVKKTLLKLALKKSRIKEIDIPYKMSGSLGMAIGYEDEITPAKVLDKFAKEHPALKLVGGIYGNKFIDQKQVLAMAKLPGKEELLAKLVWLVQYPVAGLVNVMQGNLRGLVYVLKAISEKKPTSG